MGCGNSSLTIQAASDSRKLNRNIYISVSNLAEEIKLGNVVVLNCSFSVTGSTNFEEEHNSGDHIPGAKFIKVGEFRDAESSIKNMAP